MGPNHTDDHGEKGELGISAGDGVAKPRSVFHPNIRRPRPVVLTLSSDTDVDKRLAAL